MFGLFGAMLAFGYLLQGVGYVRYTVVALLNGEDLTFVRAHTIMALDFSFGFSLLIAGIGLLFMKEWARKMWLITASALVLVHLVVIMLNEVYGLGVTPYYLVWTWMVALSTGLAWWYFSQPATRSRFQTKAPKLEVETVNAAE
jgi:hypothetical protein